jgi:hypothetical protein
MKELKKDQLENIQGGFNKSFWNGFCDGAIFVGLGMSLVPHTKLFGEVAIAGLSVVGCFNGPAK